MSNRIKIRRGSGIPKNNFLPDYELGCGSFISEDGTIHDILFIQMEGRLKALTPFFGTTEPDYFFQHLTPGDGTTEDFISGVEPLDGMIYYQIIEG